ncbi:unnamed protein product [Leuciscus chuanchicus]
MSGESPHELHSQKLDDVSVVCGDSSPLPKRAPETQRLIQCLRPPALGSTPAVQKLSDVALICHTHSAKRYCRITFLGPEVGTLLRLCWDSAETVLRLRWDCAGTQETLLRLC